MEVGLVHLVYSSRAAVEITDAVLAKIRDEGMRNNGDHGITGLLLYREGAFLQLLEGTHDAVEQTYRKIHDDPRHTDIRLLFRGPCSQRTYSYYNMGVLGSAGDGSADPEILTNIFELATQADRPDARVETDAILGEMINQFIKLSRAA